LEENVLQPTCGVFLSCCDSVASPQTTVWAPAWASDNLCGIKRATTHLPSIYFLLPQRCVATGNCLNTGLHTTIKNVRKC
jgi:hypothetical protein